MVDAAGTMRIVPADMEAVATLGEEAKGVFSLLVTHQDDRRGLGRPDTVEVSTVQGTAGFGPPNCGINELCGDVQIGSRYRRRVENLTALITRTVPATGLIVSQGNEPAPFNGLPNDKGLFVYREIIAAWISGLANFTAVKRWGFTRLVGTNIYFSGVVYGDLLDAPPGSCGDGIVTSPEACDVNEAVNSCGTGFDCDAACTCQPVVGPVCGDGTVDAGEACDPAAAPTGCGAGEVCAPGTCTCESLCGNGAIDAGEACDPVAAPNGCSAGVVCLSDCSCDLVRSCGNGVLDPGEQCDPPGGVCGLAETCSIGAGCVCVPTTGGAFAVMHAANDADLKTVYDTAVVLPELPDALFTNLDPVNDRVVLEGAFTAVGLNPGGNMNVSTVGVVRLGWDLVNDPETSQVGGTLDPSLTGTLGFRGRLASTGPFEEDVLSPGCLCEGHGVMADEDAVGPIEGGLALADQDLLDAVVTGFRYAYDAAARAWIVRSVWTAGDLEVKMDTSLRRDDSYVTQSIALTNRSATNTIRNIRFTRSLDYDIPPGHFDEDSFAFLYPFTSGVASVPQLIRSVDDQSPRAYGVGTVSPFMTCANGITFMTTNPDSILAGDENGDSILDCNQDPALGSPGDRSSSFVFQTPALGPGETVTM
ncbi:MAG: hypothetical protein HYV07_25560 [Deltaproteobacteria bacterium]|nr:hypothetical protein [Deltaproteobacteria bacterium]